MTVYVESSAVLAWLLDEPRGPEVGKILAEAELILTSELTFIESERALIRLTSWREQTEDEAEQARERLHGAATHWSVLGLGASVLARARKPFPGEPIRTLDALHLASALVMREAVPPLVLVSLDSRVRDCGLRLGFEILPGEESTDTEAQI